MYKRKILAVDGGGCRGALTACILAELERQTGKLCRDIVDFTAGTSTGALISASICAGLPASDIVQFYANDAPTIFDLSPTWAWPKRLAHGHAFDSDKIADVLRKRFGAAADWTLNDCPIRVLLCACGVNGHVRYFTQDRPKNAQKYGKLSLVECATASAAAPSYLTPFYVNPLGGKLVGWSVDGGIADCSNPVYRACVEAFCFDDFDPNDTLVISLGTGYTKDTTVNPPSGFIGALSLTIDSLLYTAGRQATEDAQRHYPHVVRMNWELDKAYDMADADAIPHLIDLGKKFASDIDWLKILEI